MIKYIHFNNSYLSKKTSKKTLRALQSRTLAIDVPNANEVKGLAKSFLELSETNDGMDSLYLKISLGVAMLHPEDNYEKKTGREQAVANIKSLNLEVGGIVANKTHVFVSLEPVFGIKLSLRVNKKTGFVAALGQLSNNADAY